MEKFKQSLIDWGAQSWENLENRGIYNLAGRQWNNSIKKVCFARMHSMKMVVHLFETPFDQTVLFRSLK